MTERAWWRDAVVYQLYVRSFGDANGDGAGDLEGIIERLDHLDELGVDAVWLTPCYPSPQHDHGYDVADYRDIDPLFGTLADADELMTIIMQRKAPALPAVPPELVGKHVLAIAACVYILSGLHWYTYAWFLLWLSVVLAFYFLWGRRHSVLERAIEAGILHDGDLR